MLQRCYGELLCIKDEELSAGFRVPQRQRYFLVPTTRIHYGSLFNVLKALYPVLQEVFFRFVCSFMKRRKYLMKISSPR